MSFTHARNFIWHGGVQEESRAKQQRHFRREICAKDDVISPLFFKL
jgi:hypothetical protein